MECYVSIKRNSIKSVVDTGATVSIMTLSLMRKLGLTIDSPSKIIAIIADESRKRALGQIHDVPIVVQGGLIPTTLQIIDFRDDNLLLGTDWCINVNAKVDFGARKLMKPLQSFTFTQIIDLH